MICLSCSLFHEKSAVLRKKHFSIWLENGSTCSHWKISDVCLFAKICLSLLVWHHEQTVTHLSVEPNPACNKFSSPGKVWEAVRAYLMWRLSVLLSTLSNLELDCWNYYIHSLILLLCSVWAIQKDEENSPNFNEIFIATATLPCFYTAAQEKF